jgi:hypothetical protein
VPSRTLSTNYKYEVKICDVEAQLRIYGRQANFQLPILVQIANWQLLFF